LPSLRRGLGDRFSVRVSGGRTILFKLDARSVVRLNDSFPSGCDIRRCQRGSAGTAQFRTLRGRLREGTSVLAMARRTTVQKHGVTFMGDLRANRGRYAVPVLGIAMYLGLKNLGVDLWIAIVIPMLLAAGLGLMTGRRS
jgi:hypothetical protein